MALFSCLKKNEKVTVLLHPKFPLAKNAVHKYNELAYEICAFSVSLRHRRRLYQGIRGSLRDGGMNRSARGAVFACGER